MQNRKHERTTILLVSQLRNCKNLNNIKRLAKFLNLKIDDMTEPQIRSYVEYRLIHPKD